MKSNYALHVVMCLLLAACSSLRSEDTTLGTSISGVNYSDQPITYVLSDPDNPASVGGEPVDPFGAGGLVCCFRLPETWRPGIKVRVQIFDTNRKDLKDDIVELPPYVDGKPGQLWAVYHQDGSTEVFSSQYGPPHAMWPARVKGWPVPNVEYRRKLWERDLNLKMGGVRAATGLLKELETSPEESLNKSWAFDKRYREKDIERYSGPRDPAYKDYLQKRYEQFLESSRRDVDDWMKRKP